MTSVQLDWDIICCAQWLIEDYSRLSEKGGVIWTGSCQGRRVIYGVMCVNVSLPGSMWKSMYVHR